MTKKKNQFTSLDVTMCLVLKISSEMAGFRAGFVIPAGYLAVWYDKQTTAPNVSTSFFCCSFFFFS